jgi:hypothetical protein
MVGKTMRVTKTLRQTFAVLGVIGSLAFVGLQIHESNRQARAAAYQAIGIATSEFHRSFDARLNRLVTESAYPEAVQRWSLADWEALERISAADLRMLETVLLQVDQAQLPADAIVRLGYNWGPILANPGYACIWPDVRDQAGASVRKYIEDTSPPDKRVPCKVNLQALRDATVTAQRSATAAAPDIDGTYLLVKRVMAGGKELKSPVSEGLYTLNHGQGNLNIFWKKKDGKLASESTILRYQLDAGQYCAWISYTVRNEIDGPGISTDAPRVTNHCTPVEVHDGRIVFAPPVRA